MAHWNQDAGEMENDSNNFSVSFDGQTSSVTSSLFPVKDDTPITISTECDDDLDWLESKSFLSTAILLAEEKTSFAPEPSSSQQTLLLRQSADIGSGTLSDERYPQESKKASKRLMSEYEETMPAEKSVKLWKEEKQENQEWKKEKEKKHKKKKQKDQEKRTKQSSSGGRDIQERKADAGDGMSKIFIEEIPGLQPEHAFRLDHTAENSLWNYESICKNKIAKYFCLTHHCLGSQNLLLHHQDEKQMRSFCRYFTKNCRKEIRTKGMFVTQDKCLRNETTQYIAIRKEDGKSDQTNKIKQVKDPFGLQGNTASMYSHGKWITATGEDEEDIGVDETMEKTAYYNRHLHDDPHNIKLWLEFVEFQNQIFQDAQFSPKPVASRKQGDSCISPLACIEKKLSILDKALKDNPTCLELKIKRLEIQQDVTDSSTLAKEWDKLLFVNSADVKLWRHYLVFYQSRLASFTVGHIIRLYHRCFSILSSILQGQMKVVKKSEKLEEEIIGVFEQYCNFLLQAGFTEKAVSSYQALIEFNMFPPPSLNLTPTVDRVAAFESFWNSGVARFGETGAKGWAAWVTNPTVQDNHLFNFCGSDMEQEQILAQNMTLLHTWLGIEQLRQCTHWLSWRPNFSKGETEEDCEDLDRLILCEDVAPVLFCLSKSTSCYKVVTNFVQLLGLAQHQRGECYMPEFNQLHLATMQQVSAAHGMDVGLTVGSMSQPHAQIVHFLEEVLRQAAVFFTGWYQSYFTSQLLQLQVHKHGDLDVTSLTAKQLKEVRKFGKSLLKQTQNRNDLMLWNKYIRLEWALGKTKDALSMLQTALTMFTSNITSNDDARMAGLCSLYRTSAEISLNFTPTEFVRLTGRKASPSSHSKNSVVISFICLMDTARLPDGNSQSATAGQVLKTRRKFQTVLKGLISSSTNLSDPFVKTHIIQCVICFALFELCAAGLEESLKVFNSNLQLCSFASQQANTPQIKNAVENIEIDLTESLVSFLKNCMSVEALPLVQIRSYLHSGLSRFPDNPTLLRHLVELESMSGFRRLRQYFQVATQEPASVYPMLFEILSEMRRYTKLMAADTMGSHIQGENNAMEYFGGTGMVHRVRATCERALQHKIPQYCPLVWRLYLHFEAKYGNIGKAEGVFYRALQKCPWAKVLYLDGIELFGTKHFQELVDLMTEKELRIQIPLEEVELLIQSEPQDTGDHRQPELQNAADDRQPELLDTDDD